MKMVSFFLLNFKFINHKQKPLQAIYILFIVKNERISVSSLDGLETIFQVDPAACGPFILQRRDRFLITFPKALLIAFTTDAHTPPCLLEFLSFHSMQIEVRRASLQRIVSSLLRFEFSMEEKVSSQSGVITDPNSPSAMFIQIVKVQGHEKQR